MNDKMLDQITHFFNSVSRYIHMEYEDKYYKKFHKEKSLSIMFDIVGMYYMGGNSVPYTAGIIVDSFKHQ